MKAIEMRRWTRDEYDKMIAAGVFEPDERVELVEGEILQMTPQGSLHATAIQLVHDALRLAFGQGFIVRIQGPLAISLRSEPEPDIAVVRGVPRDYRNNHPATALLIVEVSETSLEYDRNQKRTLYARAGVGEYWILNLNDRCVEVYRDPKDGRYCISQHFFSGEHISPTAVQTAGIAVSDILP